MTKTVKDGTWEVRMEELIVEIAPGAGVPGVGGEVSRIGDPRVRFDERDVVVESGKTTSGDLTCFRRRESRSGTPETCGAC